MRAAAPDRFTVIKKRFTKRQKVGEVVKEYDYEVFAVSGWLKGQRIRKQFKTHGEALTEKDRLEVEAADEEGTIRPANTRLSAAQLTEAEAAFARLGERSLTEAIEWFLANYRPSQNEKLLGAPETEGTAAAEFLKERAKHVRGVVLNDYRRTLTDFCAAFPSQRAHEISTGEIQAFLDARNTGKKRFNNLRDELHAFFVFCLTAPRKWIRENPVTPIPAFRLTRGLPEIMTAGKAAELMAFVESYDGGPNRNLPAGCLAPYFALCLFAGIRPDPLKGEIQKLAARPDLEKFINADFGAIRISPELSKV